VDSAEPGVRDEVFSQAARNVMGQTEGKYNLKLWNGFVPTYKNI
jgi:hypothetical protein